MDTNLVYPRGVDQTEVIFDFWFADVSEAAREFNRASIEIANRVQDEDEGICRSVQRGLRSRAYDTGRLSVRREAGEQLFHQLLHADLQGGRAARLSPWPTSTSSSARRSTSAPRALCLPQNWRRWAGHIAVGSYDLGLEREYWAIRNARGADRRLAADEVPDRGPGRRAAARPVTPRNIAKLADRAGLLHRLVRRRRQAARRRHGDAPRRAELPAHLRRTLAALARDERGRHGRQRHRAHRPDGRALRCRDRSRARC